MQVPIPFPTRTDGEDKKNLHNTFINPKIEIDRRPSPCLGRFPAFFRWNHSRPGQRPALWPEQHYKAYDLVMSINDNQAAGGQYRA